ncbi:hypothetical protein L293_1957 [Acinetobacter gyllenbergii CIP 110306 = MTCC 11365]|nr:hypothetical protein L293_1957 [Acinetobacter gyllenbergii CIP 110306 = MTCC 11365]
MATEQMQSDTGWEVIIVASTAFATADFPHRYHDQDGVFSPLPKPCL